MCHWVFTSYSLFFPLSLEAQLEGPITLSWNPLILDLVKNLKIRKKIHFVQFIDEFAYLWLVYVLERGNKAEWPEPGYLDSMLVSFIILVKLLLQVRKKDLTISSLFQESWNFYSQTKVYWYS